ncbi:MAG: DUF4924 family protein [Rikenellaceae bacterium]
MLIAKQKRRENIAEYILYLWQLEDVIRALEFDEQAIYKHLVENSNNDDSIKQMVLYWYIDIANIIKSEGKSDHGHMEHTIHLIGELNDLHLMLLKSDAGKSYLPLFLDLAPHLKELRNRQKESSSNDIELCFKALYGVMLQRIKQNDKFDSDVIELISPVIAMLSHIYLQVERGEVDLYKNDEKKD